MLFYELIQVALGNRDGLSRVPSDREWLAMYEESEGQAIPGILLAGLERLRANTNGLDYTNRFPQELLLQWIGISEQIRQINRDLTERCIELQKKLSGTDVRTSILKGQGIAMCYPAELRGLRQSGDIDIFVDCGFNKALSTANNAGFAVEGWDYKHAHLSVWEDTEVEMHYRVEVLLNLWKNRKLQKWFKEHTEEIFGHTDNADYTDGMVTPSVEFNVFYILLHIYRHFLYEGVGLRQIIDYYMVLCSVHDSGFMVQGYVDAVREFGMMEFARGLMWMMKEALGLPREWMLWEPDEKEGRFILDEVMAGGNFGHHDQRLSHGGGKWNAVKQVCRHNWHLMSHYPADVVWAPVWFVWHKCWKILNS